jgi:hypothetical protein
MRTWPCLVAAALAVVLVQPGSAFSGKQKPYVLTAIADIGTVYWRYDCVHYRSPEWSLGVRVFADSATTGVTFRAETLRRRHVLQPGDPVFWFPFRRELRQRLSLAQGTEPRTLYGTVKVRFGGTHLANCKPYAPPRVVTALWMKTNF